MGSRIFKLFKDFGAVESSTFLVWDQFISIMAIIRKGTMEEKAELIYNLFDLNMDSYISKTEMALIFSDYFKVIKSLNADNDLSNGFNDLIVECSEKDLENAIYEFVSEIFNNYAKREKSNFFLIFSSYS